MDIFKQNRNLMIVVGVLIVFNLLLLFLVWNNSTSTSTTTEVRKSPQEMRAALTTMLKKELDFSDDQVERYLQVRFEHHEKMRRLQRKLSGIKKEMFDAVLAENSSPTISDSLLALSLETQGEIERLTYKHFEDLKNICSPEQQKKLKLMMHQVLAPLQGERPDGRPPLRGERPGGRPPTRGN